MSHDSVDSFSVLPQMMVESLHALVSSMMQSTWMRASGWRGRMTLSVDQQEPLEDP